MVYFQPASIVIPRGPLQTCSPSLTAQANVWGGNQHTVKFLVSWLFYQYTSSDSIKFVGLEACTVRAKKANVAEPLAHVPTVCDCLVPCNSVVALSLTRTQLAPLLGVHTHCFFATLVTRRRRLMFWSCTRAKSTPPRPRRCSCCPPLSPGSRP